MRSSENSPALQCWVCGGETASLGGTAEKFFRPCGTCGYARHGSQRSSAGLFSKNQSTPKLATNRISTLKFSQSVPLRNPRSFYSGASADRRWPKPPRHASHAGIQSKSRSQKRSQIAKQFLLAGFIFMKTYRILGILWLVICSHYVINLLRGLIVLHPNTGFIWWGPAAFCLLYLIGIVASIFLFRGARWARWFIAVLAVWEVVGEISYIVLISKSFSLWSGIVSVFTLVIALVSLALLFLPRQEPVA